jgi:FAD:protein FMN transferase
MRAQVFLGTFVEIALPAAEASEARFAAAFAAIAHVHRTMSAHDRGSDLARIGRDAHRRTVVVDADTYAVLLLAQRLFRESGGAFDVTVAPVLVRSGMLPAHSFGRNARCGRMDALTLESGFRVRSAVSLALDLGGIAKGYAVDRAVDALRAAGVRTGRVNAGGDLHVFGDAWVPVRVRHPAAPAFSLHLFDARDAAVATSADYFGGTRGALVDPSTQCVRPFAGSLTVVAPMCALADALTKIVALRPAESAAILARHGAHAFALDAGNPHLPSSFATTCATSTANVRLPLAVAA